MLRKSNSTILQRKKGKTKYGYALLSSIPFENKVGCLKRFPPLLPTKRGGVLYHYKFMDFEELSSSQIFNNKWQHSKFSGLFY